MRKRCILESFTINKGLKAQKHTVNAKDVQIKHLIRSFNSKNTYMRMKNIQLDTSLAQTYHCIIIIASFTTNEGNIHNLC